MSGGGSLGLGKQKTDSQSQSSSYGVSNSMSQDNSASFGSSVGGSGQTIAFEDLYKQLYGGANAAAGAAAAGAPEIADAARQLFTGGTNFLQGLGADKGTEYLDSRLTGNNPALQEQIDLLRQDTGQFFNENINPAITSRAVAGGTLGGGRQGVAQGIAADAAGRSFASGAATLRANDLNARDAAAMAVSSNSVAAANTGLGALPGLLDVATRGVEAPLTSYSALASIMGGPTTLTSSFSDATQQSIANAFSRASGLQTADSESTSRGRGWNFSASGYGGVG